MSDSTSQEHSYSSTEQVGICYESIHIASSFPYPGQISNDNSRPLKKGGCLLSAEL